MADDPVYYLMVDDREENLVALEGLLRRDGLVLLRATSGVQALELLLEHDVALALVDVQMPGMDGFELAELMRGAERTRRVPIIFVTAGSTDQQRRFRGYEAGAVDFLQKPIEPDVLKSKADVFFELYRQRQEVARQRDELEAATEENQRLLDETRRYAEALKEADRRKDEFLATLSHELRNPLVPLRSGLEILRTSLHEEVPERVYEMMDRQVEYLSHLVDDLLDVSRITSGKVVLRTEHVELRELVEAAVEAGRPFIESRRHELVLDLPREPIWVSADRVRMAQVLSNLLNNAAKYTPEGGRITLSVAKDADASLCVSDTGAGIPGEMLEEVFEMFAQVNRTLERSQGGLGIGLAVVKRLVEMHGGSITVESPGLGEGSAFTVRLPAVQQPAAAPEGREAAEAAPRAGSAGRRILLVEDNVDAAESLTLMLDFKGHVTRMAHSGPDALEIAREFGPEVVFLDIGLPGMDGYQVAKHFRADPVLSDIVLVALTGWGSEDDKRKAADAGFDHHMTKPVQAADMERAIEELVPARSGAPTQTARERTTAGGGARRRS
jgi:signal transduction histidine kinase